MVSNVQMVSTAVKHFEYLGITFKMNGKWNKHTYIAFYKGRAQLAEMLGILIHVPHMPVSTIN